MALHNSKTDRRRIVNSGAEGASDISPTAPAASAPEPEPAPALAAPLPLEFEFEFDTPSLLACNGVCGNAAAAARAGKSQCENTTSAKPPPTATLAEKDDKVPSFTDPL
jgi:hypothetical protein